MRAASDDVTQESEPGGPDAVLAPNTGSKLFGRGLLYVIVWSLQLVVGSVVSPILAHLLGPTEFGALASAIALYQVLSVFALLGLDQAVTLQRAEDPDARAARGLVSVGIAIAFAVTLVIALTAPLWRDALGFTTHVELVYAVILWTAPAAAVQVMLALLVTEDRLRPFAIISGVAAVGGQLVGIALLFFAHNDATTYAWGGVASQFLAMAIGLVATRPRLRGLVDWSITGRAIRLGLPLAFNALAYFVLNAGDRVVIQSLKGPAEVGRYQVAYVVGSVVLLLLSFTSSAWTPRLAQIRDEVTRWAVSAGARDELYRLLAPAIVGITLAAPIALRVVAPESYRPDSLLPVVFVVALSAFPVASMGATGRLLVTLRRGAVVGVNSAIAAIVNIGLNLLLLPPLGILGSALATLVSYSLLAVLHRRAMPRDRAWPWPSRSIVLIGLLAVVVAGASVFLPQTLPWNLARFAIALACLPWFLIRLRRAHTGLDSPAIQKVGTDDRSDPAAPVCDHGAASTPRHRGGPRHRAPRPPDDRER